MLHLRRCILARFLSSPAISPVSPLQRLLSAAAPRIFPNPSFAVEEYLVGTCGLARAQAGKASAKLSHVKSPANADAVLAFLASLGLSSADAAAVVAKDPRFLCSGVGRTLAPILLELTSLGLSRSEIARLVSLAPSRFRSRFVVSSLQYYLPLFGSFENLLRPLRFHTNLLTYSLERIVKPNVAILREYGLGACDIAKLCSRTPRVLTAKQERVRAMLACAEGLGVPRGSGMFRYALQAVQLLSKEKIAAKVDCLKKTFTWSDAEVSIAVSRFPFVLCKPKESLQRRSEFFFSEVGLELAYIAHRPVMLALSLEGRLRPRYYVVKFLKENGLLDHDWSYYTIFKVPEKVFVEKFICPHKVSAPHLAEDYAAACRGEVLISFRFT